MYSSENQYISRILNLSDCIITGPYRQDQKESLNKIGSQNKELIFLNSKLTRKDFSSLKWEISGLKEPKEDNSISESNLTTELFFNGHSLTLSGKKNPNFISSLLREIRKTY